QGMELLPVAVTAGLADFPQGVLLVLAETFEQLVLEREEELRAARVALASGAADELAVDAQRLVALGAEDVQAAGPDHRGRRLDVGAASGHVRGDRARAVLPRERDDLRLASGLLGAGVEHLVRDVRLPQPFAQLHRLVHGSGADEDGPALRLQA